MTNRKKYALMQDDSCHWYLVPWDKKDEFWEYIDAVENYDYNGEEPYPQKPEWAKAIDGPQSLAIIEWEQV